MGGEAIVLTPHEPDFSPAVEARVDKRRLKRKKNREIQRELQTAPFTLKDVEYVLRKRKGVLVFAALDLGVSRLALKRYIENSPSLQVALNSIKQEMVDKAEAKLFEAVEEGYYPAVVTVLKTLGKDRGYTERATLEHEIGPETVKNSAALIEAMRKGATPKTTEEKEYEWVEARYQDQTS